MPTFTFRTAHGVWTIRQRQDGRWMPWFNDEALGSYHSAVSALDDLLNNAAPGAFESSGAAIDTSAIGLPESLGEWSAQP